MKEEKDIKMKYGTGNHFTVPEGYFEHLTSNIMENLPDMPVREPLQRSRSTTSLLKWSMRICSYAAAACLCGAILFGTTQLMEKKHMPTKTSTSYVKTDINLEDSYINNALDYAMVSNQEIALYLTDVY